jgi:hypothetical protein
MNNEQKHTVRWEPYIRALQVSGVPEEKRRWYLRRAERFGGYITEKQLHGAVQGDADNFISSLWSSSRSQSWQLRQADDASRIIPTDIFGKS